MSDCHVDERTLLPSPCLPMHSGSFASCASSTRRANGPKIPVGRDKQALLLVDMQAEHFEGARPEDETRLLAAVKTAIAEARRRGHPVIALRHGWQTAGTRLMARMMLERQGPGLGGGYGNPSRPRCTRRSRSWTKHVQDGFENPELGALLDRLGIGRLRIRGAWTGAIA